MDFSNLIKSSKTRMILLAISDVLFVIASCYLALALRFDLKLGSIPPVFYDSMIKYLPIQVITVIIIFYLFKLYNSVWAFASSHELVLIMMATFINTILLAFGMVMLQLNIPRSFFVFYFFLELFLTFLTRFSYRSLKLIIQNTKNRSKKYKRTMVVGAGDAGSIIISELIRSELTNKKVICVIDDNPSKKGKYIHAVPIVGGRDTIVANADKYEIDEIIIAMPSIDKKELSEILNLCNKTSCKLKVLPGVYQLINGDVSVSSLRDVAIEDLLGRDSIKIDMESVKEYIKGKTVLVTGGGGSIGSELCRQIASYKPKCLIIFDIYENNAYDIQQELKAKYQYLHLEVLIGSVRNTNRIESIMSMYRPNIVFHAAAHKHVPLMEDSPNEAIKNNVFGTYKTAKAADKYGVEKFVLISTDKAVNPTNIMGASKRMCEMIIQMFAAQSNTEFVAVRFGNVLGSNGSVIPLFKKQMAQGGPVTVTHPDIIRYFMTIPEAVSLVLQAGAFANGGEIFVLDMGEPVKIADLAKNLIRLSGYTLGVDMEIEYTGLRPGEKLFEELLRDEEGLQKTDNKLIFIGKPINIEIDKFVNGLTRLEKKVEEESFDVKSIVSEIVPSYHIKKEDILRDKEIYDRFNNLCENTNEK
ncbi:MAG: nucleoside-diphosphate sugar epimerase/dehydratase [Erysipelotrichaceae bacterium]